MDHNRTQSSALADYRSTTLGAAFADIEAARPGDSGFTLLRYGRSAFTFRLHLIDMAQKTIDLQVYIWEADETGRIIAERLISAADRGVRVRLLVDDLGFGGRDRAMVALDAHPNIELRAYNPFMGRGTPAWDFLTDTRRVNRRMHNKITIVDNSVAIVGGRNIGDHYFSVNRDTNFRDLDIAAVGPVVRDVSAVFDQFWSSDFSISARTLLDDKVEDDFVQRFVAGVREEIAAGDYPYSVDSDLEILRQKQRDIIDGLVWARGWVVWDRPLTDPKAETAPGDFMQRLDEKIDTVDSSLIIESAYFVVRDGGVEKVRSLVERGVDVRIMTNSLVSNDVLAAHAGHAKFRDELLDAGATIYEMRPDSSVIKKTWVGNSRAGLHTKALVFDGESLVVGSFNLDPRSANLNTEAGIYVESEVLAQQLLDYMDEGVQPQNSYRLDRDENSDLVWITQDEGEEIRFTTDPRSTWTQRFVSGLIQWLPIEAQL